ncbi:MAG TPA: NADH-quinone oxidoreductase subunit C, partial [Chloroflexota bacterium]
MVDGREARTINPAHLAARAAALVADGARLLTFVGTDDRPGGGGLGLHAVLLAADGSVLELDAEVPADDPRYPAISARVPAFHWDERELRDLLGVVPEGHPDPRRLVLRESWPDGLHPLRKDFDPTRAPAPSREDAFSSRVVEGHEVTQIPVGPIHAGIIEPGHFRFSAIGETVLHLDAQLFYTHRGIEKLAEGRTPSAALAVAERACAACALSHGVAFANAVEAGLGITPPPRASWGRTLLLEIERLYNHLGDAGNMCSGGAFAIGAMAGAALKELVQRRLERLVGHRFGRGAVAIGGLRRDLPPEELAGLREELPRWRVEALRFRSLVLGSDGFVDRMRRAGVLPADLVRAFGGVGVLARASGVDHDLRRDRPYEWYRSLPPRVPRQVAGDAEARFNQRLDEVLVGLGLLEEMLDAPPAGPIGVGFAPATR